MFRVLLIFFFFSMDVTTPVCARTPSTRLANRIAFSAKARKINDADAPDYGNKCAHLANMRILRGLLPFLSNFSNIKPTEHLKALHSSNYRKHGLQYEKTVTPYHSVLQYSRAEVFPLVADEYLSREVCLTPFFTNCCHTSRGPCYRNTYSVFGVVYTATSGFIAPHIIPISYDATICIASLHVTEKYPTSIEAANEANDFRP